MTTRSIVLTAAALVSAAGASWPWLDAPQAAPAALYPIFTGACDASAGLFLDARYLAVADDEDVEATTLRIYDVTQPGAPVGGIQATEALNPGPSDGEVDLEGLTRFGAARFVAIGSHSRKKKEALDAPSRQRLLAFTLTGAPPNQEIASSQRYITLIADAQAFFDTLLATDPLHEFILDAKKGSKDGGLSIEAVTETDTNGELLIGLRSPLAPGDKAIVLVLKNAGAVLDTGARPAFAAPILLDLGKQGLRDLVRHGRGGYLLIAGDPGEGGEFALWWWSGPVTNPALKRVASIDKPAKKASAEALVITPDHSTAWILFDEGERENEAGVECKKLGASKRSFHARRIDISSF